MRLFACVVPPDSVLDAALRVQRSLLGDAADTGRAFRPVPRENLHVTLHFFGDVDDSLVPALLGALDHLALTEPIPLRTAPAGCFPNCRAPRAVWLGAEDSTGRLAQLAARVAACAPGVAPKSRPHDSRHAPAYRPHITLARVRPAFVRDPQVARAVQACGERSCTEVGREFAAQTIVLMQSVLNPGGAEYRRVHEV